MNRAESLPQDPPESSEDEFAFDEMFDLSAEEKKELQSIEKDQEEREFLGKEVALSIYDNLQNLKDGKEINDSLVGVIPEGEEITNNLKALKKEDLMPIFAEYTRIKEEEDAEAAKLHLFFDVKNANIESLIMRLESVSDDLNKDLIKDLVERDKLEKRFKKLDDFMKATKIQTVEDEKTGEKEEIALPYERVYLSYANTFGELLEEDNIRYLRGQELVSPDVSEKLIEERIKNMPAKLGLLIDWELESIDKKEFEYGQMSEEQRQSIKNSLEDFKKLEPEEIFEVKNLAFIGQITENRINSLDQIKKEYERLNQRISEYFPSPF